MGISGSDEGLLAEGTRNCLMQLWHRTWPHRFAMTGLDELDRIFRHEGHDLRFSLVESSSSSLNWMVTSFCIESGWGLSSGAERQVGVVLGFFDEGGSLLPFTSGVRDGVQKDGSEGLAA